MAGGFYFLYAANAAAHYGVFVKRFWHFCWKLCARTFHCLVVSKAKKEKGEYIVIWRNEGNYSVTEGYFYCIRNAFAHGDFDVDGKVYTLKNEAAGKIKGMARLKETSLLAWIDLVNMDIEDIKRAGK